MIQDRTEYRRRYYQANRERMDAQNKAWRRKNNARSRAFRRMEHLRKKEGLTASEQEYLRILRNAYPRKTTRKTRGKIK